MASPGFPFCECLFPKSHYFGPQDGLPHLALQTASNTEHKERPQSEVNPSGQAGGGFNKWSNLIMRLVLRGHKRDLSNCPLESWFIQTPSLGLGSYPVQVIRTPRFLKATSLEQLLLQERWTGSILQGQRKGWGPSDCWLPRSTPWASQ